MPTRRLFLELLALSALAAPAAAAVGSRSTGRRVRMLPLALDILGAPESLEPGIDFGIDEVRHAAALLGFSLQTVAAGMEATASITRDGLRVGNNRNEVWTVIPPAVSLAPAFVAWLKQAGWKRVWWMPPAGPVDKAARDAAATVGLATATTLEEADLVFWSSEPAPVFGRPAEPPALPAGANVSAALAVAWVPAEARVARTTYYPALWHSSLSDHGADGLNARFRARTRMPLDSHGWAGWLAVKAVIEATRQGKSANPDQVREALSTIELDGHKGRTLAFLDRRLVQPVYVVGPDPARPAAASVVRGELSAPQ
jgi:hypothetical protein